MIHWFRNGHWPWWSEWTQGTYCGALRPWMVRRCEHPRCHVEQYRRLR